MHGLKVGEVTDVRLTYDTAKDAVLAPVRYEVEPERIVGVGTAGVQDRRGGSGRAPQTGLAGELAKRQPDHRAAECGARLRHRRAAGGRSRWTGTDFVVPTTEGGGFAGLASSATELLNKVNTMPFDQIGTNLNGILKSVNDVAQGPQMKKALTDLAAMIASAQGMVQNLNSGLGPQRSSCPNSLPGCRRP